MKSKVRSEEEKKYLQNRLKTIEGQIRGISKMVEEERYCGDIIIQISAVNNSLKALGHKILKNHLKTCVVEDIKNNKLDIIDEVIDLTKKIN